MILAVIVAGCFVALAGLIGDDRLMTLVGLTVLFVGMLAASL